VPDPSSHQKEQPGTTQAAQLVADAHASPQEELPELDPELEPEPEPEPEPDPDPEAASEQSENAHWPHWPLAGPSEVPRMQAPVSLHQPHPEPAVAHCPHEVALPQLAVSGDRQPVERSSPSARSAPLPTRSLGAAAPGGRW